MSKKLDIIVLLIFISLGMVIECSMPAQSEFLKNRAVFGLIKVYHEVRSFNPPCFLTDDEIKSSVEKYGLCSAQQLATLNPNLDYTNASYKRNFSLAVKRFHNNAIHFSLQNRGAHYYMLVDPYKIYVYNANFTNTKYIATKLLLATYLQRVQEGEELKRTCNDNEIVEYEGFFALPKKYQMVDCQDNLHFILSDGRVPKFKKLLGFIGVPYQPEILIHDRYIPADRLYYIPDNQRVYIR